MPPTLPYAAVGSGTSFEEGMRRVAGALDDLGVVPPPRLDWRALVGPDNAVIASVGVYQVTVEETARFGADEVEWRIDRSAETFELSALDFTREVVNPALRSGSWHQPTSSRTARL